MSSDRRDEQQRLTDEDHARTEDAKRAAEEQAKVLRQLLDRLRRILH